MRSFKWWIMFGAVAVVFFVFWPKAKETPVLVVPEHETAFSFLEGARDGIKNAVRRDLGN